MSKNILIILLLLKSNFCLATEYQYILNDNCINRLFYQAEKHFENTPITTIKDSRGIILRFEIEDIYTEFYTPNIRIYKIIESFLAKIENSAIIEVHTGKLARQEFQNLKNWEISTVMANNIEAIITKPCGTVNQTLINSVGYGEFLPAKNTSNNGGKYSNRVDIIVLCNISGE